MKTVVAYCYCVTVVVAAAVVGVPLLGSKAFNNLTPISPIYCCCPLARAGAGTDTGNAFAFRTFDTGWIG